MATETMARAAIPHIAAHLPANVVFSHADPIPKEHAPGRYDWHLRVVIWDMPLDASALPAAYCGVPLLFAAINDFDRTLVEY